MLQDPNDKDVKIKFIDFFQPPFPGKVCVFFFVFFGVTGKVFFTEWLLFSPIAGVVLEGLCAMSKSILDGNSSRFGCFPMIHESEQQDQQA